jgi:hypothetical protein
VLELKLALCKFPMSHARVGGTLAAYVLLVHVCHYTYMMHPCMRLGRHCRPLTVRCSTNLLWEGLLILVA